jgi:phage tail sheath gpL-like
VGGSINGVAVTVTWATSDTATATALAAAINASANALVSLVTASSAAGVVTLTADHAGLPGNAYTLAASGTGVTASGARLTGGASTVYTF